MPTVLSLQEACEGIFCPHTSKVLVFENVNLLGQTAENKLEQAGTHDLYIAYVRYRRILSEFDIRLPLPNKFVSVELGIPKKDRLCRM
jgi:hypothetical protein